MWCRAFFSEFILVFKSSNRHNKEEHVIKSTKCSSLLGKSLFLWGAAHLHPGNEADDNNEAKMKWKKEERRESREEEFDVQDD